MHPYYMPSVYGNNVIDIADAAFPTQFPFTPSALTDSLSADYTYKKRKIDRACDACRRRKTKCDGPHMPDNVCTNCIQNRKTCSYVEASKPRGPPKAYITSLEDRLEKMEALLKRSYLFYAEIISGCRDWFVHEPLRPDADFSGELGPPVIRDSWKTDTEPPPCTSPHDKSALGSTSTSKLKSSPSSSSRTNALPTSDCAPHTTSHTWRSGSTPKSDTDSSSAGYTSSDSEEVGELSLSRGMKRLTIRGLEPTQDHLPLADNQVRFHGKSSFFKLIGPTRKLRDEHVNRLAGGEEHSCSTRDSASPVHVAALHRPEFWTTPPWEFAFEGFQDRLKNLSLSLAADFPPQDLAESLIKLYFEHVNLFVPLFHRPTFERQWRQGLQHRDTWFGCLCLSLFAVASRWSNDPRVLDDSEYLADRPTEKLKWQRAGWRFFNAAVDIHRGSLSLFHPAGLFEVQTMALLGMFLRGTAFHPVAWLFFSVGLRKAQDVGAHRKKIYGDKPSAEGELWKRAFWVLVLHDRVVSASLGRPCCSGEEEFDAVLPLEVDDEYWEAGDPEKSFQQPPGKPSRIAAFNSHLKLTKIVAYAMRTIYALDRSKLIFSAARPRWPHVLARLNREMTEWVDSVPKHLHWSPQISDVLFSNQSATLYITYYLIQIIIYRPFLPPSLHSVTNLTPHSNMPIPCIAICVNAANLILCSHVCAAVLLMNFWDLKWQERNRVGCDLLEEIKSPLALAMAELLEEISVFVAALEAVKHRWRVAEMYLNDLSSSFPHSLGGFEPSFSRNDLFGHNRPCFDDSAYCGTILPDSTISHDYRVRPSDHVTPSIIPYSYNVDTESPERSPHFFEYPHITRYPVPSTLPIPTCTASRQRDQPVTSQSAAFPSQQGYKRSLTYTHFCDPRSSTSSTRSQPTTVFDERTVGETHATPGDTSACQQYAVAGREFWDGGGSVLTSTPRNEVNNFEPNQSRLGWASDFHFDPAYARASSSKHST